MHAKNYEDLVNQLAASPISVEDRGKGRTKEQTQPWMVNRLLPSLAKLEMLGFPLEVVRRERPDLCLKMPTGSVGIELTEAVPQAYAQAVAIRNQCYPNAIVDRSIFRWGAKFSAKQIHEHLSKVVRKLTGPGWYGESVEYEWATSVNDSIVKKTEKINSSGFTIFPQNWMAIYTSSPGANFTIKRALPLLSTPLPGPNKPVFDVVFVFTDAYFVMLKDSGFNVWEYAFEGHVFKDIWPLEDRV